MTTVDLDAIFRSAAAHYPDNVALRNPETSLTFRELDDAVDRAARGLRACGIPSEGRIGIAIPDGVRHIVSMLAIWRAGGTAVPLDSWIRPAELDAMAANFDLAAVIGERPLGGTAPVTRVVFKELEGHAAEGSSSSDERRHPADTAVLSLTSGTTGTPRGALISHSQLYERVVINKLARNPGPDDLLFAALPVRFGAVRQLAMARLFFGGGVYFYPSLFAPDELVEAVNRSGARSMFLVPSVLRTLLPLADGRTPLFPALEVLDCGGDALAPEEKIAGLRLISPNFNETYGSSTGGLVTLLRSDEIERHADSIGRPVLHVHVEIVDGEDRPVPQGNEGRLRFAAPGVATTFIGGSDTTGADRVEGVWAYPGDLAMIDEDGFVHLRGRESEVIIRGGANISPEDIEAALAGTPGVEAVCAVGWPSARLGEEVALFVVARDERIDETAVLSLCRERLSPQLRPRSVFLVDSLPYNASGKVMRRKLRERLPPLAD